MRKYKLFFILNILFFIIFNTKHVQAENVPENITKNILILNSYHKGFEWTTEIEHGVFSQLKDTENDYIDTRVEYMDSKDIDDELYMKKLLDLYKYKYKSKKFDLIICSDDTAFEFLNNYRNDVFPNVPIIFCGINNLNSYNLKNLKNMTGSTEYVDIEGNIKLIEKLHPNINEITAVIDNSHIGKILYENLVEIKKRNKFKVKVNIIKEDSLKNAITKIKSLPSNNALLFMATYFKDTNGNKLYVSKILPHINQNKNIPIYGIRDIVLNFGVVGGKTTSGFEQGKYAGETALKILHGQPISTIPVKTLGGTNYIFNYYQLKNFSININNLPKESTIINSPPSVYSLAKDELRKIAGIIIFVFILIILFLIINILKRKKVEYKIRKISKIKEAMLMINQSIIGIEKIDDLFDLILEKAIEIIDAAEYGSILILNKDGTLKIIASKGYDKEKVKFFSIPLEHSFLWVKSKGTIKNTAIINNIDKLKNLVLLEHKKENWNMKSCISSPIMINDKLYGMLNIDSDTTNIFNQSDLEIMEYIRSQIEISISKLNLYQEITYLSKYDNLTNIYNRKHFKDIACSKLKDNEVFSLVVFDLNKLKFVNDNYGHLAGDEYIKTFANHIKTLIGTSDIIARYGGDEFVGIFYLDVETLTKKFEDLLEYFNSNPLNFLEANIPCSFSYGIATFPYDSKKYDDLIRIADDLMYTYKQNIKNCKS